MSPLLNLYNLDFNQILNSQKKPHHNPTLQISQQYEHIILHESQIL